MKKSIVALTAGLGAGAGLMYLFDPKRGRARRGHLAAEATGLFHRDEKQLEKRGKDLLNRVRGMFSEAAAVLGPDEHVTDDVLAERVRSRMGHVISNPHEIQVHAAHGVVRLEGKLSHADKRRLRKEIEAVPGVRCVHDGVKHRFTIGPGILVGIAAGMSLLRKHREAHTV